MVEQATSEIIDGAVAALRGGGVVVYPTETLYGLGADATSEPALERVAALKGRDREKPISVLVASRAMLESLVSSIPAVAERLIERFWPGALTIAFPARAGLPARLTGGGATVAARVSSHATAQTLVERLGRPITSTSATPGGEPPALEVARARAYFGAGVDAYVDGGRVAGGLGSTVVDCSGKSLVLVRAGSIAPARIEAAAGMRLARR